MDRSDLAVFMSRWPLLPLPPAETVAQEPAEAREAVEQAILPAEPSSPAVAAAVANGEAICPVCFGSFVPSKRGRGQLYCSSGCRIRAGTERQRAKRNGEVAPEPEPAPPPPEPEPERECEYCLNAFTPRDPAQRFCSRECKLKERRDRRGYPLPSDYEPGYENPLT